MATLREDMLVVIQMKRSADGWIRRREIVFALDTPGLEFTRRCVDMVATLERQGWIESRKVGRMWEYRAK